MPRKHLIVRFTRDIPLSGWHWEGNGARGMAQEKLSNDSDIGGMTATNPALEKAIVELCLKITATNLRLCKVSVSDHNCRDNYDRLGWQG
jgi:hypothetical protein